MTLITKYKLDEASIQILEQRLHKNGAKLVIIDDNIYIEVPTRKELLKVESCKPLMKLIDYLQQIQNWNLMFDHDAKHDDPSFGNLVTSYIHVKNKMYEDMLSSLNKKIQEFENTNNKTEEKSDSIKDIYNRINDLEICTDKVNDIYVRLTNDYKDINSNVSIISNKITDLETDHKTISDISNKLEEYDHIMKQQDERIIYFANIIDDQTEVIKFQQTTINNLTNKINEYDNILKNIDEKINNLSKKKTKNTLDDEIFKVVSIENYMDQ